ncbi:unnamed protein product [Diatraea saccharalis]|uniref:Uncharacterized protein n=1 Tax=Diatraea saccharalis TaxID=40085 RepID=A0A9N9R1C0_9NEOP|nr:unnamed protein product [Diatraea saccharalis]
MEAFVRTKRKKRKTRKYLDEMRKRCRKDFASLETQFKKKCIEIKHNYIKGNLSKINMFTNAVRSETITRPLFSNIRCEQHQSNNRKRNTHSKAVKDIVDCHQSSSKPCRDYIINHELDTNNIQNYNDIKENCSDELIPSSPLKYMSVESCNFDSANNEKTMSSSLSEDNYGNLLYEELLDTISMYIKNNFLTPKDDLVVRKTKESLQKIRPLTFHNEINKICIATSDDWEGYSIKEKIIQNPMDYIKLGCMMRSSYYNHREEDSDEDPPTRDGSYSSYYETQNLHSPLSHMPEYDFFPHKLNL